jgi:hypothetical protein
MLDDERAHFARFARFYFVPFFSFRMLKNIIKIHNKSFAGFPLCSPSLTKGDFLTANRAPKGRLSAAPKATQAP